MRASFDVLQTIMKDNRSSAHIPDYSGISEIQLAVTDQVP